MSNLRPGLIEVFKNKIRFIGFTKEDLKGKYDSNFISEEEYTTLLEFFDEYEKENK